MSKPIYHVRHDLQPSLTEELLLLLASKSPCRPEMLQVFAQQRGYRLANRTLDQLLASLNNLKITERNNHSEISLTHCGQIIAKTTIKNPELLSELVHFTYYTLYDNESPALRFSWAYRQVCDYLWSQGKNLVRSDQLVTLVQEQAQLSFGDVEEFGVSFSRDSVNGIVQWLEELDPPCIFLDSANKKFFARRTICSASIVLLILEYLAFQVNGAPALQLQLTAKVRQDVARLCLLEPDSLDELLPDVAQAFGLVYRQTERGQWISLLGDSAPFPLSAW
jgi:hypothetical protein